MQADINYLAVLACGVAAMVFGFLWYGPLFGKSWAKEMGWDMNNVDQMSKMKRAASTAYPQQFVTALIMAVVFAHVLWAFDASSYGMALEGAFWTWLGFIAPVKYGEKLWSGRSFKLFFIDGAYFLIQLGIFAIILFAWK